MSSIKWECKTLSFADLDLQKKNPRTLSKNQKKELSKSLNQYGYAEPIVVNTNGVVIGGHQRLRILRDSGEVNGLCMVPDRELENREVDELTIRLNKNVGEFDFDMLANGYDPEDLLDWGFTMDELHLEALPESEDKPEVCQITMKFESEVDLREAEDHVVTLLEKYTAATYKVKIK